MTDTSRLALPHLRLEGITKYYGSQAVISGVTASVSRGIVVGLMGPSGSGKSTLLRCINRIVEPDEGTVWLDGQPCTAHNMAKLRRSMGMVFQQFHLFPHMTVAQNIMLAPRKVLGLGLEEASERCIRLLRTMGMETLADRLPSGLSGGQRQRVAIARALAMEPKCMIFDEPTSALDPENIKEVVEAMEQVIAGGVTALIASHDLRLLRRMADVIWFLEDGHLVEITPGERFFERPTTERAEQFLNRLNWMERP